jgi:hypothetical protein
MVAVQQKQPRDEDFFPDSKKLKTLSSSGVSLSHLSDHIVEESFLNSFSKAFQTGTEFIDQSGGSRVHAGPFTLGVLKDVFSEDLLREVKTELLSYPLPSPNDEGDPTVNDDIPFWTLRSNDLYHFYQSPDFKGICSNSAESDNARANPLLRLKDAFRSSTFIETLGRISGLPLRSDKMDLAAQIYPQGGYLLCHDDDMRSEQVAAATNLLNDKQLDASPVMETIGRRIAFILYLVDEDWTEAEGGQLELFGV